jgi:hypothetical protein
LNTIFTNNFALAVLFLLFAVEFSINLSAWTNHRFRLSMKLKITSGDEEDMTDKKTARQIGRTGTWTTKTGGQDR